MYTSTDPTVSGTTFPFSHSRSDSTYAPANTRNLSMKRTNSIRSSKNIIPLRLTAEQTSAQAAAAKAESTATEKPKFGHRRGFSVGVARPDSSSSLNEAQRKTRPGSMFFSRMFPPKEDEVLSTPHLSPGRSSHTESSHTTNRRSVCLDSRSLDYFSLQSPISLPASAPPPPPSSCDCASTYQKVEARLKANITDLETERVTKDLTIQMLSEQLLDKSQELDLLRQKMQVLESFVSAHGDAHLMPPLNTNSTARGPSSNYSAYPNHAAGPARNPSSCYSVDEGLGSSSASATTSSRPQSPTIHQLQQDIQKRDRRISLNSINPEISYEELIDENVLLKEEVSRLTNVLEDGLGALADLGL